MDVANQFVKKCIASCYRKRLSGCYERKARVINVLVPMPSGAPVLDSPALAYRLTRYDSDDVFLSHTQMESARREIEQRLYDGQQKIEQDQRKIEEQHRQIRRIPEETLMLGRQRNGPTLITSLPREILEAIFAVYSHLDLNQLCFDSSGWGVEIMENYWGPYEWLQPIMQVCQRWRDVALCAHSLWANILLDDRSHIQDMLLRSGNAPLTLVALDLNQFDNLELCLPHLHRVRELGLHSVTKTKLETFNTTDSFLAPRLWIWRSSHPSLGA
ncbi:hypothetical protein NEOLEDRAFT_724448 [Neolentinus lepideus HHB14362 ss-1]|uniref:Uncharacterized protein n=1 Tax=Neolentinus lepideus HHB14362 ss-1 TaxID=1314782 RepID=A0A165Q3N1_9AGAM|nr:hypothetical protein NEOLEDRAFT_724448 [Neolentinus lepideus HHB14362 ss-1]